MTRKPPRSKKVEQRQERRDDGPGRETPNEIRDDNQDEDRRRRRRGPARDADGLPIAALDTVFAELNS